MGVSDFPLQTANPRAWSDVDVAKHHGLASQASVPDASARGRGRGARAPRARAVRDDDPLEIVNQTVDLDVNLEVVYDALASLLLGYYRRRQPPAEGQTR